MSDSEKSKTLSDVRNLCISIVKCNPRYLICPCLLLLINLLKRNNYSSPACLLQLLSFFIQKPWRYIDLCPKLLRYLRNTWSHRFACLFEIIFESIESTRIFRTYANSLFSLLMALVNPFFLLQEHELPIALCDASAMVFRSMSTNTMSNSFRICEWRLKKNNNSNLYVCLM